MYSSIFYLMSLVYSLCSVEIKHCLYEEVHLTASRFLLNIYSLFSLFLVLVILVYYLRVGGLYPPAENSGWIYLYFI